MTPAPATASASKKTTPGSVPAGLGASPGDQPPAFSSRSRNDAAENGTADEDVDYADWPYNSKFFDFWDAVEQCAANREDPCKDLCDFLKNKMGANTRHPKNGGQPPCVIVKPGIPVLNYGTPGHPSGHPVLEDSLRNYLLPPAEEFENPTEDEIRTWREALDPTNLFSAEPPDQFFIGKVDGDADENAQYVYYIITVKITQKDGVFKYELSKLNLNTVPLHELVHHYFSYALEPGSEAGANLTEATFQFDGVEGDIKIVVPWVHENVWKWISEGRDPEKLNESAASKGKSKSAATASKSAVTASKSKPASASATPKATTSKTGAAATSASSSSSTARDAKPRPSKTSRVEDLVPRPDGDEDVVDGEGEGSDDPPAEKAPTAAKKKAAPSASPKKTTATKTAPKNGKEEEPAADDGADDELFAPDDEDDAAHSQAASKDPHADEKVVLSKTGKRPVDVSLDDRRAKAQKISAAASPSPANGKGAKPAAPTAPKAPAAAKAPAAKATPKKAPAPATPKGKAASSSSAPKPKSTATPSSKAAPPLATVLVERYERLLDYRARFHAPLANGGIDKINERLAKNGKPTILDYPTALEEGTIAEKDGAVIERLHIPHLQLFAYIPELEDVLRQRLAELKESLVQQAVEEPEEENEFDIF